MKNNILIYSTISFGDVWGMPIDHVRVNKNQEITITYDCTFEMIPKNREKISEDAKDQVKIPHDTIKFDYKPRGKKFLTYSLKRFCYELKTVEKDKDVSVVGIKNIKLVYLSIDGKEETLLDTSEGKLEKYPEIIEFEDGEVITEVIAYLKNDFLCGLYITTNKKAPIPIGDTSTEARRVLEENGYKDKVFIGLGCTHDKKDGVTSIYFYVVDKMTFSIYQTIGIRQLRAKIKKNEEFKNGLGALRTQLNKEQKLLSDVAKLPDAVFFSILKYVMPY